MYTFVSLREENTVVVIGRFHPRIKENCQELLNIKWVIRRGACGTLEQLFVLSEICRCTVNSEKLGFAVVAIRGQANHHPLGQIKKVLIRIYLLLQFSFPSDLSLFSCIKLNV